MNKTIMKRTVMIAGMGWGMLAVSACNKQAEAPPAPAGAFAVPVTTMAAVAKNVPIYLDEIGHTTASESVTIQPQVSGKIMARHFVDGADVKKGDLLFEIDVRPFKAAFEQAEGQLVKDQAQKASAEWNVSQDTSALATKAISEQQLHNDTATRDQAVGSIAVDQAAIDYAKLNVEYCSIRSPIDGRAGVRLVDVGNVVVGAGQTAGTNLLSIQTLDPIYADFTITEAELLKVQQYQAQSKAKLSVFVQLPQDLIAAAGPQPATQPSASPPGADADSTVPHPAVIGVPTPQQSGMPATAPAMPPVSLDLPRKGELIFMDNAVQDGSGTVKLRAGIPNADHHFWPNQYVNVRLVLAIQQDAVLVPAQSIQISQTGPFVFVVNSAGIAQPHPVVQGQRQGDMVVIERGLTAGDAVVVTGQTLLMPGGKVMVVNGPGAVAPPAAAAAPSSGNNQTAKADEGKQS